MSTSGITQINMTTKEMLIKHRRTFASMDIHHSHKEKFKFSGKMADKNDSKCVPFEPSWLSDEEIADIVDENCARAIEDYHSLGIDADECDLNDYLKTGETLEEGIAQEPKQRRDNTQRNWTVKEGVVDGKPTVTVNSLTFIDENCPSNEVIRLMASGDKISITKSAFVNLLDSGREKVNTDRNSRFMVQKTSRMSTCHLIIYALKRISCPLANGSL